MTCNSQCTTNWPLRWARSGSRDLNLKFGTPSITFEWIKLRTPSFVGKYTAWRLLSKYENLTPKGVWLWSRDHFRNFGTPFISLEWPKIGTLFLVVTLTITCTSQCRTNWPLKWAWSGSCDLNFKIWDPLHNFRTDKATHSKFCGQIHCLTSFVEIWKSDP